MSNMSQEEESQASIHRRQPRGGSYGDARPRAMPAGGTAAKRRRSLPGNPDPDAEVIALSPRSLVATNRYVCEVCHKGFQRDQNLQLHRRGHNLPWKLKQRAAAAEARKRVYVCPEASCVHHHPRRALGDLTGIKKHFSRKHGEKRWKCATCSKRYAVHSDWKAHSKICGTKEYRCDCATLFSRKDSFITHRAFCDALLDRTYRADVDGDRHEEQPRPITMANPATDDDGDPLRSLTLLTSSLIQTGGSSCSAAGNYYDDPNMACFVDHLISAGKNHHAAAVAAPAPCMSATALLQKAAEMGAKTSDDDDSISHILFRGFTAHQYNNITLAAGASPPLPAEPSFDAQFPAAFPPQGMVGCSSSSSTLNVVDPGDRRARFISTHRGVQAAASKEAAGVMIGGIRTTQDFMGLGCMEGPSAGGGRRRHGIGAAADDGLGSFRDVGGQQKEEQGADSYHLQQPQQLTLDESGDHPSAILGRPIIWNY